MKKVVLIEEIVMIFVFLFLVLFVIMKRKEK